MKPLEYVTNNEKEVLAFIRTQYPLYHLSNVFFRDIQYGIQKFFERRNEKVGYQDAEKVARAFVEKLVNQKIFNPIDRQSWVLHYPEYKTVAKKPSAPAKPAPGAAPAKSPATARSPLPPLSGAKPAGAKPALPPLGSGKPAGGARPALPPLASAKPSLPPLTSAKPVGGVKPSLPPLSSAKPVAAQENALPQVAAVETAARPEGSETVAAPKQQLVGTPTPASSTVSNAGSASAPPPAGQRKPLPPLKGKYTPAGKK